MQINSTFGPAPACSEFRRADDSAGSAANVVPGDNTAVNSAAVEIARTHKLRRTRHNNFMSEPLQIKETKVVVNMRNRTARENQPAAHDCISAARRCDKVAGSGACRPTQVRGSD
jgi:hypothetical protein